MQDDVFCSNKIIETTFFETETFRAVYNIKPLIPGHSLVIPKRHVVQITELNNEELADLSNMLKLLLPRLLKAFDADSYNLSVNAGEHAGMVINHLHFHIVPRSPRDIMQGKLIAFYRALGNERDGYIQDVSEQVARLRKIFRFEPKQKA